MLIPHTYTYISQWSVHLLIINVTYDYYTELQIVTSLKITLDSGLHRFVVTGVKSFKNQGQFVLAYLDEAALKFRHAFTESILEFEITTKLSCSRYYSGQTNLHRRRMQIADNPNLHRFLLQSLFGQLLIGCYFLRCYRWSNSSGRGRLFHLWIICFQ